MGYLLGLDLGTSSVKTVLFDEKANVVTSASAEYPLYQPQPQWAEQMPKDWWEATAKTIKEITSKVPAEEIKGVGLTGQMHGLVLLDKDGEPLCPSIIWCDQRTKEQCAEIYDKVGKQKLIDITCNPALTGFTLSKLLWVRKYNPEAYEKAKHMLLPKDFIRYKLTGEFATDVSDASGTQLLDIANRKWSEELCDILDINKEILPKLYESFEITGTITEEAAKLTGLKVGTPVGAGAGDQAAAAVGCGIVKEGEASLTLGSSGVIFAHSDKMPRDKEGRVHTFCHAVPGKWHVMSVTQGAGLSLKWFKDNFCSEYVQEAKEKGVDVYNLMFDRIKDMEVGTQGLVYLPYLMGERSPILDPDAKGVFYGLTNAHDTLKMFRSVAEGVVMSQLDCFKVLQEMGIHPSRIRMSGGGARNPIFRQMFADSFKVPVAVTESPEAGTLGVSILVGVGIGLYPSVEEACEMIKCSKEQQPQDVCYCELYKRYKKLYNCVKNF